MNKYITYLTIIAAACFFNAMASERIPLLKAPKQEVVSYDHLTELPAPIQLHILEFVAADSEYGSKTIKSLACINTTFNLLCGLGKLNEEIKYPRSETLKNAILQNVKINDANIQKLLDYAHKNKLKDLENKAYNSMNYQSGCIDNCQDCCVCTLPWYKSPWQKKWDETCQENYTKRIKQKYGFIPANILGHGNYDKYKESRKHYLGAGACILMWSARTATQVLCCPVCVCAYATGHDCCNQHENDRKNFAYAETSSCSWALWPCGQVFKYLD